MVMLSKQEKSFFWSLLDLIRRKVTPYQWTWTYDYIVNESMSIWPLFIIKKDGGDLTNLRDTSVRSRLNCEINFEAPMQPVTMRRASALLKFVSIQKRRHLGKGHLLFTIYKVTIVINTWGTVNFKSAKLMGAGDVSSGVAFDNLLQLKDIIFKEQDFQSSDDASLLLGSTYSAFTILLGACLKNHTGWQKYWRAMTNTYNKTSHAIFSHKKGLDFLTKPQKLIHAFNITPPITISTVSCCNK